LTHLVNCNLPLMNYLLNLKRNAHNVLYLRKT
ncbi:zf-CCHC domain-containing protein, partial [Cephalotus follicularis]